MKIKLPKIFQNHMIIQQGKNVIVWGECNSNSEITAHIQGQVVKAVSDSAGNFKLTISSLMASDSEVLELETDNEKLTIEDVAVGEVWLAGGQSNMEFFMHYEKHFEDEKKIANNPNIRFYDVPEIAFTDQDKIFDYNEFGRWRKCSANDLEWFSGVGYFFSKMLNSQLDVPVGIIGCNFGGTTASAWMNPEKVRKYGNPWMEDYHNQLKMVTTDITEDEFWKLHKSYKENDKGHPFENDFNNKFMYKTPPFEECMKYFQEKVVSGEWDMRLNSLSPTAVPGALYEYMLKTIAPYTIKGVLFYQGESDENHAEIYSMMLSRLIDDWRDLWNENLPFLMVQLPGFGSWMGAPAVKWHILREQQLAVADAVSNVYLTSISDAGEEFDIHPKDKQIPGERLALLALGKVYEKDIICEPPRATDAKIEGQDVVINFVNGNGLKIAGDDISFLTLSPDVQYKAETKDNSLVLHLNMNVESIDIAIAQKGYFKVNLYNSANIPAIPFSIKAKK